MNHYKPGISAGAGRLIKPVTSVIAQDVIVDSAVSSVAMHLLWPQFQSLAVPSLGKP